MAELDHQLRAMEYEEISLIFTGWSLREIKEMPVRERRHWHAVARWRNERRTGA